MAFNGMRRTQQLKNFSRAFSGVFGTGDLRKKNHEFIAALAADGVRAAHAGLQPFCNGLKKLIADGMPERIVDVFEAIQIHKKDSDYAPLAARQGNRLSDA